jgi:fumarate reductase flavoprotein subunit
MAHHDDTSPKRSRLSRRAFLKAGGAGVAVAALGALPFATARALRQDEVDAWDRETDVLIIGYGGAGAAAAVVARDEGAEVVILEKREVAGGATIVSGGATYSGVTPVQEEHDISDSVDALHEHHMAAGGGLNDSDLVRVLAERSGDDIAWLQSLGAEFTDAPVVGGSEAPYGTEEIPRVHAFTFGDYDGGIAFFRVMADAAEERGAEVEYDTRVERLVADDDGAVIGVRATRGDDTLHVRARKAVIIATGGFTHDDDMLATYSRAGHAGEPQTPPGLTGDGHKMAFALGADAWTMWKIAGTPGLIPPGADRATAGPLVGITVNERGERFMDETGYYDLRNQALANQPGSRGFVVFDDRIRANEAPIVPQFSDSLDEEVAEGRVHRADSLEELAEAIDVPGDRLVSTVERWNEGVADDDDPDHERTQALAPIEEGPFYALEVVPTMYDTAGGVRIDPEARVVNVFGDVIPRLYAAGQVAGGVVGETYVGGTSLSMVLTFGRIAGRNAAEEDARS